MRLIGFDHIVLCVADVERSIAFYAEVLGMEPREERAGKWSLHFGAHKISLQDARSAPDPLPHRLRHLPGHRRRHRDRTDRDGDRPLLDVRLQEISVNLHKIGGRHIAASTQKLARADQGGNVGCQSRG